MVSVSKVGPTPTTRYGTHTSGTNGSNPTPTTIPMRSGSTTTSIKLSNSYTFNKSNDPDVIKAQKNFKNDLDNGKLILVKKGQIRLIKGALFRPQKDIYVYVQDDGEKYLNVQGKYSLNILNNIFQGFTGKTLDRIITSPREVDRYGFENWIGVKQTSLVAKN